MIGMNLEKLEKMLEEGIIRANTVLDEEVMGFLKEYDGIFSEVLKENARIAEERGLPLCQDTGMVEFFVLINGRFNFDFDIYSMLEDVVRKVYLENPFRYSIVDDPLFDRRNTMSNTPPIVHILPTEGRNEIRFLIKGGGSENLSALFMMNPTSSEDDVIDRVVDHIARYGARSCPPLHVGIGIGGTSEKAMVLSKLALTKGFKERNPDGRYAELEMKLLERLNGLGIGYQGLGSGITVYSVHVEHFPTHIATLPLAISVDCYLCRRGRIVLDSIE